MTTGAAPVRSAARARGRAAVTVAATVLLATLVVLLFGREAPVRVTVLVPTDGAVVGLRPTQVILKIDGPAAPAETHVAVTGPDGRLVSTGSPHFSEERLVTAIVPAGPGSYRVGYHVRWTDGRELSGLTGFTVGAGASEAAPPPASVGTESGGHEHVPRDPLSVGLLLLNVPLVLGGLALLLYRPPSRRR